MNEQLNTGRKRRPKIKIRIRRCTVDFYKLAGAGLCEFKPTFGVQIWRNGMGYISKKKDKGHYCALQHKLAGGGGGVLQLDEM